LDQGERWRPWFEALAAAGQQELLAELAEWDLGRANQVAAVNKLRRSAEGRSVPLSGTFQPNDEIITLLAAGFARSERGSPAIPYARLED
jgi:hypothetical protein